MKLSIVVFHLEELPQVQVRVLAEYAHRWVRGEGWRAGM